MGGVKGRVWGSSWGSFWMGLVVVATGGWEISVHGNLVVLTDILARKGGSRKKSAQGGFCAFQ